MDDSSRGPTNLQKLPPKTGPPPNQTRVYLLIWCPQIQPSLLMVDEIQDNTITCRCRKTWLRVFFEPHVPSGLRDWRINPCNCPSFSRFFRTFVASPDHRNSFQKKTTQQVHQQDLEAATVALPKKTSKKTPEGPPTQLPKPFLQLVIF